MSRRQRGRAGAAGRTLVFGPLSLRRERGVSASLLSGRNASRFEGLRGLRRNMRVSAIGRHSRPSTSAESIPNFNSRIVALALKWPSVLRPLNWAPTAIIIGPTRYSIVPCPLSARVRHWSGTRVRGASRRRRITPRIPSSPEEPPPKVVCGYQAVCRCRRLDVEDASIDTPLALLAMPWQTPRQQPNPGRTS